LKAFCCAVATAILTFPAGAGELSLEKVVTYDATGAKTAEFTTSTSEPQTPAQTLEAVVKKAGSPSMQAKVRAKIRKVSAKARAYLHQAGIDPSDVRVRLRVSCDSKYVEMRRKTSQLPVLMQSAVAGIEKPKPTVVRSLVESCSVKLFLHRKERLEPVQAPQMQDFAVTLPVLNAQAN
jgi:hypothetical protein